MGRHHRTVQSRPSPNEFPLRRQTGGPAWVWELPVCVYVCVCVGGASCPNRRPVPILSPCHCWQAVPAPERTPVPQSRVSPLCTTGLELFCLGSTFLSRPSLPWTEHPGPSGCPPLPAALPPHDLSFPRVSCETRGPPPTRTYSGHRLPSLVSALCALHSRAVAMSWRQAGPCGLLPVPSRTFTLLIIM